MTIFAIDTSTTDPLWTQRTMLDGVEFILRFDYSEREDRYRLSVGLTDGTWLARGVKVIADRPLLYRFADARLPLGDFRAIVLNENEGDDPGFGELGIGKRATLYYFDVDEIPQKEEDLPEFSRMARHA